MLGPVKVNMEDTPTHSITISYIISGGYMRQQRSVQLHRTAFKFEPLNSPSL